MTVSADCCLCVVQIDAGSLIQIKVLKFPIRHPPRVEDPFLRLTVRTDLAMRILMYCAVHRDHLIRSAHMAAACNSSIHHVAQVVNHLAGLGYLQTLRGRAGGVRLARDPALITVGEVFVQFEAGVPLTECFDDAGNTCPLRDGCRLRGALVNAVGAFYRSLDDVTLEDLVCDNVDLKAFMPPSPCRGGGMIWPDSLVEDATLSV